MDSKTSQQILDKVAELKATQNSIAQQNALTRAEAHNNILKMFLLSGGVMGGLRGLQGVLGLGNSGKRNVHHPGVTPVPIPIPKEDDEEEKVAGVSDALISALLLGGGAAAANLGHQALKHYKPQLDAANKVYNHPGMQMLPEGARNTVFDGLVNMSGGPTPFKPDLGQVGKFGLGGAGIGAGASVLSDLVFGEDKEDEKTATDELYQWWQHPEALPGLMLAGLGGGYGGYKLIDSLMDTRRSATSEDELEAAKREYREALSSHLSRGNLKAAEEKSAATLLGEELDALFDKVNTTVLSREKKAGGDWAESTGEMVSSVLSAPGRFYDWITKDTTRDTALGMYGAYAIPTLLAGYMAGKGLTDRFSDRRVLEKAMKERSKIRAKAKPPSLYAVPVEEDDES